ncbi:hypothetical protein PCASD_15629 [Puccinia coronata f. sp. avenae]|uniref:Uncharacterized protein n=1 Tax=Puccinia coronata f. sp. avenae TaxID=200324 RepID=A0A2N5SYW6_9BASI|nr:hypothetical protein PCASD_15629 [Puccinia coronata f. sp. avenae]
MAVRCRPGRHPLHVAPVGLVPPEPLKEARSPPAPLLHPTRGVLRHLVASSFSQYMFVEPLRPQYLLKSFTGTKPLLGLSELEVPFASLTALDI